MDRDRHLAGREACGAPLRGLQFAPSVESPFKGPGRLLTDARCEAHHTAPPPQPF